MMNIVTIQGRLTRDPELRRTNRGKAVVSGSVACERDYKGNMGEKITDFIPFVVWGEPAERMSKYLCKGQMVILSGQLYPRKWKDKGGVERVEPEVKVDRWNFGEPKKKESENSVHTQGWGGFGNFGGNKYPGYGGTSDTDFDGDEVTELPF